MNGKLFIAFLLSILVSCANEDRTFMLEEASQDLIKIRSLKDSFRELRTVKHIVVVGPSLIRRIKKSQLELNSTKIEVRPLTDEELKLEREVKRASYDPDYLINLEGIKDTITILLKYDKELNKFHIVGFVSNQVISLNTVSAVLRLKRSMS